MTWPIAHEANRCKFWTSCPVGSWKRPFLCIMRNFEYSWLTEMRILVRRVVQRSTESTLKMSYLRCFRFSFCQRYKSWTKGDTTVHYKPLCTCFMDTSTRDWVVHILDMSNICVGKIFFLVHNAWIWALFDHNSPTWFQVKHSQSFKKTRRSAIIRVFCYPDVYSKGSSLLHDSD